MTVTYYTYNLTVNNDGNLKKNELIEYKREEQHHLKFNVITKFTNKGDTRFMFEFRTSVVIPNQTSFSFHTYYVVSSKLIHFKSWTSIVLNPNKIYANALIME